MNRIIVAGWSLYIEWIERKESDEKILACKWSTKQRNIISLLPLNNKSFTINGKIQSFVSHQINQPFNFEKFFWIIVIQYKIGSTHRESKKLEWCTFV